MSDTTITADTARARIDDAYRRASYEPPETPEQKRLRRAAEGWQGERPELEKALEIREKDPAKYDALGPNVHQLVGHYEQAKADAAAYAAIDKTRRPPNYAEASAAVDHARDRYLEAKASLELARDAADREKTEDARVKVTEADRAFTRAEFALEDAKAAFVEAR